MKWAKCKWMRVPMVGLSDGLIHILFDRYRQGRPSAAGTAVHMEDHVMPSDPAV